MSKIIIGKNNEFTFAHLLTKKLDDKLHIDPSGF